MKIAKLAVLTSLLVACNRDKPAATAEEQMMEQGLRLLYQSGDPVGAQRVFSDVLQRNPSHYGAQFQLATALDRGGRPVEARVLWQRVLTSAETVHDTVTQRRARERLAAPDTSSQEAMMALGLDLLYSGNNPRAAADQFRKILAKNPTHYGATFQLASALEKSGQTDQAKLLWQKVLGMATMYKDTATANTARSHLR